MKVLITGSEGSLMQWVIPYLIEAGHEVIGVDNYTRYGPPGEDTGVTVDMDGNVALRHDKRKYTFIRGDLTNKDVVRAVCEDIDFIIQAAAQVYGVGGFHRFPADILSKDIDLHQNILWEALRNNVKRVIYISSSMVYERATQVPVSEDHLDEMRIPLTDYGLAKFVNERLCKAFKKQYSLDYTIWRPFNIITPYERAEKEMGMSHVFADFLKRLVIDEQNPLEMLGDGNQIRCFTWIDDTASAIAKYSFLDSTKCETFNLGNTESVSMKELAQNIFDKLKEKGYVSKSAILLFNHLPAHDDDVRIRIPSIEKAQKILGWNPTMTLDESLNRCIDEALKMVKK